MPLTRTTCPECGAGLKSAAGFNPGQQVRCPKCSAAFAVPSPEFEEVDEAEAEPAPKKKGPPVRAAAGDDADRPRRKRRPRDDDEDEEDEDDDRPRKKGKKKSGYKNSPVRFAVLGVLLVVMGVLAYMLYEKKQREKEDAAAPAPANANGDDRQEAFIPGPRPNLQPGGPKIGTGIGTDVPPRKGNEFRPTGDGPNAATTERGMNDLKKIMVGMHNHSDRVGTFPKAAITDAKTGKAS